MAKKAKKAGGTNGHVNGSAKKQGKKKAAEYMDGEEVITQKPKKKQGRKSKKGNPAVVDAATGEVVVNGGKVHPEAPEPTFNESAELLQGEAGALVADRLGRPFGSITLTSALAKKICDHIRMGNWLEVAAWSCGIHRHTLRNWLVCGNKAIKKMQADENAALEPHELRCANFVMDIHEAAAESEMIDVDRIDRAAENIWQAAAWRLQRRYPERWRERSTVQHEGGKKPVEIKNEVEVHGSVESRRSFLIGVLSAQIAAAEAQEGGANGERSGPEGAAGGTTGNGAPVGDATLGATPEGGA